MQSPNECGVSVRVRQVLQYRSSCKVGPGRDRHDFASRTSFYRVSDLLFHFRRSSFLLEFSILLGSKIKDVECILWRIFELLVAKIRDSALRDDEGAIKCQRYKQRRFIITLPRDEYLG